MPYNILEFYDPFCMPMTMAGKKAFADCCTDIIISGQMYHQLGPQIKEAMRLHLLVSAIMQLRPYPTVYYYLQEGMNSVPIHFFWFYYVHLGLFFHSKACNLRSGNNPSSKFSAHIKSPHTFRRPFRNFQYDTVD